MSVITLIREDDVQAHIEDTRLFWVNRGGYPIQVAWNELTDIDREQLRQAEERSAQVTLFSPCGSW